MSNTLTSGILTSLPGRYAKALFDLAYETNLIDDVAKALHHLEKLLKESESLQHVLMNPTLERSQQSAVLREICERIKAPEVVLSFLDLLVKTQRISYLSNIGAVYNNLVSVMKEEEVVEVVSAHPLTTAQIKRLKGTLEKAFLKSVQFTFFHDPRVLGGIMVRAGSWVVDSTVRTRLNQLATAMKGST